MFLKQNSCSVTARVSMSAASVLLQPECPIPLLQFLPHSGDRILITGAADSKVHVHDLTVKETVHMFGDHTNRVKRIATAPMWPNTFWSAAEDGLIRYRIPVGLVVGTITMCAVHRPEERLSLY